MSTLPDFTGPGYFAGEAPDGLTTVAGVPVPAQVRVYWRAVDGDAESDVFVAETDSAADGTWQITGLNPELQYIVRGIKSGYNDVTVVGCIPTRTDVVTVTGAFVTNEDGNGVDGSMLIEGGLPPYTVSVIDPLPYGLEPVINYRTLTIAGSSDDEGAWQSKVRVTASNGPHVDVPLLAVVGLQLKVKYAVVNDWEITLQWGMQAPSGGVIRIYRSTAPMDAANLPAPLATLPAASTEYADADIEPGETYYYRVAVSDGVTDSISAEVVRSALWTPADLTEQPSLWIDKNYHVEIENGRVARWGDIRSPTLHYAEQANVNQRPELADDGYIAFRRNGLRHLYGSASLLDVGRGVGALWAVVVGRLLDYPSTNSWPVLMSIPRSNTGDSARFEIVAGSPGNPTPYVGGFPTESQPAFQLNSYTVSAGDSAIIVAQAAVEVGEISLHLNGVKFFKEIAYHGPFSQNPPTQKPMFIGGRPDNSVASNSDLAALLVGNSALDERQMVLLEGWAAHRFGLTSKLQEGHPYKSVAP